MQASSSASSSAFSTPWASITSSRSGPSSSSSLAIGKTFFKALFLNEDVRTPSQPQSRSQSKSSTSATESTATALMDVFMQRSPTATNQAITIRLPPELWLLILRYATCPPFPWSTTSSTASSSCSSTSFRSSDNDHRYPHQTTTTTSIPFHIRLANYGSEIKWKASLTRVCKEWNLWGQEFLWEDVWVASGRDGRAVVGLVGIQARKEGERDERREAKVDVVTTRWSTRTEVTAAAKEKEKKVGFGLKPLTRVRPSPASAGSKVTDDTTPSTSSRIHPRRKSISSYIKKLHIETPSMDKCCPFDLMLILERCEKLEVFIDLRSVRRGFGYAGRAVQVVGNSGGLEWSRKVGIEENPPGDSVVSGSIPERHLFPSSRIQSTYRSTPDPILQALLAQKATLKHLTFTNYKYNSDDFEGGVWFWEDIVSKALTGVNGGDIGLAATLESLEVVMSARGVGMGDEYGQYARRNAFALNSTLSNGPSSRFETGLLTSLDIDIKSINPSAHPPLSLPSLHSLRIPLTSPTLLVISTWSLPCLQSLSVVSIDFTGWRRMGFKKFMDVHGGGLIRFEIVGGGESGEEEGWITEREDALYGVGHSTRHLNQRHQHLQLPSTSPNLKHFICSSNASEWNWETPDWIAPHVLMPEHFGVERIGVWGLEGKVVRGGGDWEGVGGINMLSTVGGRGRRRRTISTWTTSRWDPHSNSSSSDFSSTWNEDDEEDSESLLEEQPFFMLQEQFGSLLRREAFPSLVCIRDMSWESDLIRRSVGIGCGVGGSSTVDTMANLNPKIPNATNEMTKKKQKGLKTLASFKTTVANRFASLTTGSSSSSSPFPLSLPSSSSASLTASPATSATTARTQTQSYKIRKFWLGVLEMCDRRGVYLEDCMGRRVVA